MQALRAVLDQWAFVVRHLSLGNVLCMELSFKWKLMRFRYIIHVINVNKF